MLFSPLVHVCSAGRARVVNVDSFIPVVRRNGDEQGIGKIAVETQTCQLMSHMFSFCLFSSQFIAFLGTRAKRER